jgi:hypothetical protein
MTLFYEVEGQCTDIMLSQSPRAPNTIRDNVAPSSFRLLIWESVRTISASAIVPLCDKRYQGILHRKRPQPHHLRIQQMQTDRMKELSFAFCTES